MMFYSNEHTTNLQTEGKPPMNIQDCKLSILFYHFKFCVEILYKSRINNYLLPRNNVKEEF